MKTRLLFAALLSSPAFAADDVCAGVRDIRYLPVKAGQTGLDAAYDALWQRRDAANACLVELVASDERMTDPRDEPTKSGNFRVGDLAFFLLLDFYDVPLESFVPAAVASNYTSDGVTAYFDWIAQPGSRVELLASVRAWRRARGSAPPVPAARE